jgi:hypothetical protein
MGRLESVSVAQTAVPAVCGFSIVDRTVGRHSAATKTSTRINPERTADLKTGGPRY